MADNGHSFELPPPLRAQLVYDVAWANKENFAEMILGTPHPSPSCSFMKAVRIVKIQRVTCALFTSTEDKARFTVEYE